MPYFVILLHDMLHGCSLLSGYKACFLYLSKCCQCICCFWHIYNTDSTQTIWFLNHSAEVLTLQIFVVEGGVKQSNCTISFLHTAAKFNKFVYFQCRYKLLRWKSLENSQKYKASQWFSAWKYIYMCVLKLSHTQTHTSSLNFAITFSHSSNCIITIINKMSNITESSM